MKKLLLTSFLFSFSLALFAQWVPTNGPVGAGNINALDTKGMQVMAGTQIGGIFILNGSTGIWDSSNTGLTNLDDIRAIVHEDTIFVAVNNGLSGNPFFYSADDGATWNPGSLSFTFLFSLALRPGLLAAGTWFGVTVSADNGATWGGTANGLPSNASVCGLAFSGTTIFAGVCASGVGGMGAYISTDDGMSWASFNNGFTSGPSIKKLLVVGSEIYAGTELDGVYRSSTSAAGWSSMSTGMGAVTVNDLYAIGNYIFAGTDAGIFKTDDAGATWVDESIGLPSGQPVLSITSDGIDVYVGAGPTVWVRPLQELISSVGKIDKPSFILMSNIVSDVLQLELDQKMNGSVLSITNSFGQKIKEVVANESSVIIPVEDLSSGTYFVSLISDGTVVSTQRFLKQ